MAERTYRRFSNLDDRYIDIHDLTKFVKFGYETSDHTSKAKRGYMTRKLVKW